MIEKTRDDLQPFLNSYTRLLLDGLSIDKIVRKIKSKGTVDEDTYELVRDVKKVVDSVDLNQDIKIMSNFLEFRTIMLNVSTALNIETPITIRNVPFSSIIEKFEKINVLSMPNINDASIKSILDKGDQLLDDNEIENDAIRFFKENNYNFNGYINSLLEFYAREKVKQFYADYNFLYEVSLDLVNRRRTFDLIGKNHLGPDVLFEIKYRKQLQNSIKDIIYQGFDYLSKYDKENKKNNYLILIVFTSEVPNAFDKAQYRFGKNIQELFPDNQRRIHLIPVSTTKLQLIEDEFKKVELVIADPQIATLKFPSKPQVIILNDEEMIDSNFLKSEQGSFSTWVKLNPIGNYYNILMNYEYVISHATDNYENRNGLYQNVFSLSLAPDKTNNTGKMPTRLNWRVWISNEERKSFYLNGPALINDTKKWFHLLVRWDHKIPKIEFLIDGQTVDESIHYKDCWPSRIMDKVYLGTWGNKHEVHYLKLPIYRLIATTQLLNNEWLKSEIEKPLNGIDF